MSLWLINPWTCGKGEVRLGKAFRRWNKWNSSDLVNMELLSCWSLGSQLPCNRTQRTDPKAGVIFTSIFFHSHFQDLQSVLGDPSYEHSVVYSVVWSVALPALLFPGVGSGSQTGSDGGERGRGWVRSQSSWNFSPVIWTQQNVCVVIQSCALGDCVTLKSFSGLLIHRNSVNSQTGALWFSFASRKGNEVSYRSSVGVFQCWHVHFFFL